MKFSFANVTRLGGLGLLAMTLSLTGCHNGDRTMGQAFNDKMTAHDVSRALAKAPVYKFEDVTPQVFDGNVQLTGFVETQEQREEAARIASGVQGVRQVVNSIMLKPLPTGRATIRDPLGRETGRVMLDTNAPPVQNNYNSNDPNQPSPPANNR
jgi:hyperosmotically inducible protein